MDMHPNYSLTLTDVSKEFSSSQGSRIIVEHISFSVEQQQILCLVGKSGCGKSTILNLISGLFDCSSGTLQIEGTISYVPQQDLLLPWRTVLDNVLLPLEIHHELNATTVTSARELLSSFELGSFADFYPQQLSGGMRQRAALVRAFVQNASIMLFDEPFSALDFDARLRLGKDLRSLIKNSKKLAVFVTHNIEEAIAIGDRVMVIGGSPATIHFDRQITIGEEFRDPVEVRKTPDFQNLFEEIWQLLGKEKSKVLL